MVSDSTIILHISVTVDPQKLHEAGNRVVVLNRKFEVGDIELVEND